MNVFVILVLLSIIPSIFLGLYVYNNDVVEKEPVKMLFSLFLGGISVVVYVLLLNVLLDKYFPSLNNLEDLEINTLFFNIFMGVGLIEESGKWLIFKKLAWDSKEFNYMYDAIVYSVFISLGFATIENIFYVIEGGIWVALVRALCSVPGHVFFAVYMGYSFGLAKQAKIKNDEKMEKKYLIISLLLPSLLHTMFNFLLFNNNDYMLIIYAMFVIYLYSSSMKIIKNTSNIETGLEK